MKCGTSHITGRSLRSASCTSPSTWIRRRSRAGDAYQSRPRSSDAAAEPAEVLARQRARAAASLSLGKAQRDVAQRDAAARAGERVQQRAEAAAERACAPSGSQCSSQSRPSRSVRPSDGPCSGAPLSRRAGARARLLVAVIAPQVLLRASPDQPLHRPVDDRGGFCLSRRCPAGTCFAERRDVHHVAGAARQPLAPERERHRAGLLHQAAASVMV